MYDMNNECNPPNIAPELSGERAGVVNGFCVRWFLPLCVAPFCPFLTVYLIVEACGVAPLFITMQSFSNGGSGK